MEKKDLKKRVSAPDVEKGFKYLFCSGGIIYSI